MRFDASTSALGEPSLSIQRPKHHEALGFRFHPDIIVNSNIHRVDRFSVGNKRTEDS